MGYDYETLVTQIQTWHDNDEHQNIIDALGQIPRDDWDYQLAGFYGRALNNLEQYEEALKILLSLEEQGKTDGIWYFRVGYALYYLGREAEAAEYFQKAMDHGDTGEDTRTLLEWSLRDTEEQRIQGSYNPEYYSEEELSCIEQHITNYFGTYKQVLHEIHSPDIHMDILIIEPTPEHNYYILITQGMGARPMEVPPDLKDLERAEVLICLPPDWKFDDLEDETWYWPIRWLTIIARLPITEHTWLAWGHTIPNGEPFAPNTELTTILLLNPGAFVPKSFRCTMPDGGILNFYQMIPLYEEEVQFKLKSNTELLLNFLDPESLECVHIHRENCMSP